MISQDKGRLVFWFLFISFIDIRRRIAAEKQSQTSNVLALAPGSTARLECRIGETESEFTIIWKSEGEVLFQLISHKALIEEDGKFKSFIKLDKSVSLLLIANATVEEAGKYECLVGFHSAGKNLHYSWNLAIQDTSGNDVIGQSRNDVTVASIYYNSTPELKGRLAAWSVSPVSTSTEVSSTSTSESNFHTTAILCVGLAIILTLIITRIRKKHILFCRHRQQTFSVRDDGNAIYTDMSQGVPEGYHYRPSNTAKLHDSVPELYGLSQELAFGTENRDFNSGIDYKAVPNDYREGPQRPRAHLTVNAEESDEVYENLHRTTRVFETVYKPEEKIERKGIEEEEEEEDEKESDQEDTYIHVTRLK